MSETASHSGRRQHRQSKSNKNAKPVKKHVASLEIEIPENKARAEPFQPSVTKTSSPTGHETHVSFENTEATEAEVRERRRNKSGTSTSLSEKYSLNTSRSSDPGGAVGQLGDMEELTVTDFTKYA